MKKNLKKVKKIPRVRQFLHYLSNSLPHPPTISFLKYPTTLLPYSLLPTPLPSPLLLVPYLL